MLPKKERLSREAFSRFFAMGRRMHTPHMQVLYTPFPTLHVSVVVSKKVGTRAVVRNKLRRRVYDTIRRYREQAEVSGVFICIMKQGSTQLTYAALKEEVHSMITKALTK